MYMFNFAVTLPSFSTLTLGILRKEIPGKGGERVSQHQRQTADEENSGGGTFEDAGEGIEVM